MAAFIVRTGENTLEAARQALLAAGSAEDAAQSAAYAGGFETPEYASQAAGNAATTEGQIFRVPIGTTPQTFNWYRRLASGSELVSPLATTAYLASSAGAGAVGAESGLTVQEEINATLQIAYIDFTDKPDGNPPSVLDTGQAVDYIYDPTSRKPVMSTGRLVIDTRPVSGGLADYYQANLGSPIHRAGMEWTQPSGADDGFGNVVLIAWASIFAGGTVPKTWCHIVFVPGTGSTGSAKWFVGDGAGNLINVKTQSFTNPPADGLTRWRTDAVLDLSAGKAYARLPDGSIMTLTDAEIAAFCTAIAITPFTFADIGDCPVICCEHFSLSNANTAKFGEFTALWGETTDSNAKPWKFKGVTLLDDLKTSRYLFDQTPPSAAAQIYAPTTALSVATTSSTTNVDATNAVVACRAGPTGKIIYEVGAYYEFTGTDTVYWRLILSGGASATAIRAADVGVTGQKRVAKQSIIATGLTPGVSYTATLQHSAITGGIATLKAGGSGGSMVPPLTIIAYPA